jgi:[2Fe-2S] binding domain
VLFPAGKEITTIEGRSADLSHPLQKEIDVPQCGYCQSGQIMSAAGLLAGVGPHYTRFPAIPRCPKTEVGYSVALMRNRGDKKLLPRIHADKRE